VWAEAGLASDRTSFGAAEGRVGWRWRRSELRALGPPAPSRCAAQHVQLREEGG
jgi:hypothetical protein